MQTKRVIFTDLDGTLLNKKYSFNDALLALEEIKEQEVPLIICTSKTRAEIEVYRKKLGNRYPFISENGGGIFIPVGYFSKVNQERGKYEIIKLGVDYNKLVRVLRSVKKKVGVKGFSDMSVKELSRESGLSLMEAKLAKKREFDEAFILEDRRDERRLIKLIRKNGLNYTKGGRYYHILGDNDKGKAVKILIEFYRLKYGRVQSIGLGDSDNDKPMLKVVDKDFLIKGPKEWNRIIIRLFGLGDDEVRRGEKLYRQSVKVLKKLQLSNGAILASPPNSRYPYVYPRDHSICILGFIEAGELKRARKALEFILKGQNSNGSFSQRLDRDGKDASYKPRQLDNIGLVLYAFAKYVRESGDKEFLKKHRKKLNKSVKYLRSHLDNKLRKTYDRKNLFFSVNSIHEFPPLEKGLEVWANAVCYGGLKELEDVDSVKIKTNLGVIKKDIGKYLWNGRFFIKNIRLGESSSVVSEIDASAYALADFGVFDDKNDKIKKTVKEIEKVLWHPKLGGICRYREYIGRNNGGWGPWPHFTLMICRHYIRLGDKKNADKYLKWILSVVYNGMLPEHIALKKDFEKWVGRYKSAGVLRADRVVMVKNIRKSEMYKKGLAYSVTPLAWPHAEFIRTWGLYRERWLGE